MTLIPRPRGASTMEAVIFDMQGTLCDVSSVRHLVECDKPDFDAFHTATGGCPPFQWVVDEAKKAHLARKVIIVMTGMNEKFRDSVVAWLTRHEVPFNQLMMRPNRDFRKDFIIKREMLEDTRLRGLNVTHAWDDNPRIVELWEHENVPVTVVPGWTGKP